MAAPLHKPCPPGQLFEPDANSCQNITLQDECQGKQMYEKFADPKSSTGWDILITDNNKPHANN